ncbi:MAG: response regulator transcription factor [Anaerolineae bacterium]|nr:response regulator transcription factor [Anaerolineae bacterium]
MLPLRVIVADDHRLFRQGLIGLMKTRRDLVTVIGEASGGREAVQMTRDLKPDVVLMDIFMPDGDGLEATACICEKFSDVHVVMLTSSEDEEHIYRAIQLGAAGYLLKDLDAEELFNLLMGVEYDEVVMTRAVGARLLRRIGKPHSEHDGLTDELTEREIEVLRLVAQGASNPQIAESLVISINTVKVHLRNILEKLCVENRTQAAAYAVRCGLAPSQDQNHPIG